LAGPGGDNFPPLLFSFSLLLLPTMLAGLFILLQCSWVLSWLFGDYVGILFLLNLLPNINVACALWAEGTR
jgi:hypothetical protein